MKIPQTPPPTADLLAKVLEGDGERFAKLWAVRHGAPDPKYRHWDTLRRMTPPEGLTLHEWWLAIKLGRQGLLRRLPLHDRRGQPFLYSLPDAASEMLHRLDRDTAGQIKSVTEPITNPGTRSYYLVSSLIEEAITSSQLEGAPTTRQVAKEMIRSGRPARDEGEQMILNNYRAMEHIRGLVDRELSPELVLELHGILTAQTMDDGASGRLRRADEAIAVYEHGTNTVLHEPPAAGELAERMRAMCNFANGIAQQGFLHPVARSILLHFWLAYDHPFVDGNGRTARALFYWSMLRSGYWLFEFVSISRILKKGPAKYAESFLYTETDENDTTYFVLSQLAVLCKAVDELHAFIDRKSEEIRAVESLLRASARFNHRQLALLTHAMKHAGHWYTIESHQKSHLVSYQTARADLLDLAARALLEKGKSGKSFVFQAPVNLAARLRKA